MEEKIVKCPKELDGIRVVNDMDDAVEAVMNGEIVARFEYGNSMRPILKSGQYAKLIPFSMLSDRKPQSGDAVLCCVRGIWMTHMIFIANEETNKCLIGSTSLDLYGWADNVLALAVPMPYIENEI